LGNELVECHSGFTYPERPLAINWFGERLEVERVEFELRIPEGKKFRVCTQDGRFFDLLYNEADDQWRIIPT